MSIIGMLGLQAGGSLINAATTGVNKFLGIDAYNDNRQVEQQQKLTDIQTKANKDLAEYSNNLQKSMYDYTYSKNTASAQVQELRKAGLNPALAYGQNATGGGTTVGGANAGSAGSGSASGAAQTSEANIQQTMLGIQMQNIQSQTELNNAKAKEAEANAQNAGAKTETVKHNDLFSR